MPKSVFADELKPLQEKSQEYKGDQSLSHCYATFESREIGENGDEYYKLELFTTATCKEQYYIGSVNLYSNDAFNPAPEREHKKLKFKNGDAYNGDCRADHMDGHGTYKWVDGSSYTGEWKKGRKNGPGTFTFPNGDQV